MCPGWTGAVVEITRNRVLMVMMRTSVIVLMFATMHMIMRVFAAICMAVCMRMRSNRNSVMWMGMIVAVLVIVAVYRAIGMNVGMFVSIALNPCFTCPASANCAHRLTPIRFRFL